MAIHLPLFLSLIIPLLFSTSTSSSDQTTFWALNVLNTMPQSISTKLSPLTTLQSHFYTKLISQPNFTSNSKFCSLAHLSCSNSFQEIKTVEETYTTKRTYNNGKISTPLTKVNPFSFFRLSTLQKGSAIHLSKLVQPLPHRSFLPFSIASKISLTSSDIMKKFPMSSRGVVENTLSYCDADAIKGEAKMCAKSLEGMVRFVEGVLGRKRVVCLSTKSTRGSDSVVSVKSVEELDVSKSGIVACHEMFLPFATYFCHSVPSSRIYNVDVVEIGSGKFVNRVVAICHMDTSSWPANHEAFKVLKFGPGEGEACHWMNEIDLAWIGDGQ